MTKCLSCSNRALAGKSKCGFHLALGAWQQRCNVLRQHGEDEAKAGKKPVREDFDDVPFDPNAKPRAKPTRVAEIVQAAARELDEDDEETEGRERVEFAKEHEK